MSMKPKRVSRDTAMNPIARAVARAHLKSVTVDLQIKLYMGYDMEVWQKEIQDISRFLTLAIVGAQYDQRVDDEVKYLDTTLKVLTQISDIGFKVPKVLVPFICDAIDSCVKVTERLSPKAVQHADLEIRKMEQAS